jgi:hypothetical protein
MIDVVERLAVIERELVALTGNQPPNPSQIGTFEYLITMVDTNQRYTIIFDGTPKFFQLYSVTSNVRPSEIVFVDPHFEIELFGDVGEQVKIVSLGAFNVV